MAKIDHTSHAHETLAALIPIIDSSAHRARILRTHFDSKIRSSLKKLINECSKRLNASSHQISHLTNPPPRLTPSIHYFHHKLQSAMRAQCAQTARQTLTQMIDEFAARQEASHFIAVASLGATEWERFAQSEGRRLSNIEQRQDDMPSSIPAKHVAVSVNHVYEALKILRITDEELYKEMVEHVDEIKLFNSAVTQGFSDIRTMGAIFIRPPRLGCDASLYYYEQLIHETSHLQLHCINSIDPLIAENKDQLTPSPLRSDLRPATGVLHATYVSCKLAYAFFTLYNQSKDEIVRCHLAQIMNELIVGIDVLGELRLTRSGSALIDSMSQLAYRIAHDRAWSTFDFATPIAHRRTNKLVRNNQFNQFRLATKRAPTV